MASTNAGLRDASHAPGPVLRKFVQVSFTFEQLHRSVKGIRDFLDNCGPDEKVGLRVLDAMVHASALVTELTQLELIARSE